MNNYSTIEDLLNKILTELSDLKALDVIVINIRNRSALADFVIVASGTSSRHINSIASKIVKSNKKKIISTEGLNSSGWLIVDFGDIILNIFKPETRKHYSLERIWQGGPQDDEIGFG